MAEKEILTLKGSPRTAAGKGAVKKLRQAGKIPGVYYQNEVEPVSLEFDEHEVTLLLQKRPTLVNVVWGDKKNESHECMIREIQRHPVTQVPIHLDLLGVTRGKMVETTVPVKVVGTPAGVRNSGGILEQVMNSVDIRCLPMYLPNEIEVDVTDLEVGESIHLRDVAMENIEWDENLDRTIATVVAPTLSREAEEEGEEAAEEAVPEASEESSAAKEDEE